MRTVPRTQRGEAQLTPLTDDLTSRLVPDCGHIVPLDRPHEFLTAAVIPH